MTDRLASNTKAWRKRQAVWKHNSFTGHARMMIANCNAMIEASTTSRDAKNTARLIKHLVAQYLLIELKDRIDE